jgi:pimeloyl-ACP methyl ester carboxylesterase
MNLTHLQPKRLILDSSHKAILTLLKPIGMSFEQRRFGESAIGLWKYTATTPKSSSQPLKRFVMIPGFGDTPLSWIPFILGLHATLNKTAHFDEFVILDIPGFSGFMAHSPAFTSFDLLLSSVEDVLDELNPSTLMGHSLGGWMATWYNIHVNTNERPKQSKQTQNALQQLIIASNSGLFSDEKSKQDWIDLFERVKKNGFPAIRPTLFKKEPVWFRLIANEFSTFLNRPEVISFMSSLEDRHLVHDQLHHITTPVFLLWGEHDQLVPSHWAETWREELKSSQQVDVHYIQKAGHSPHIENYMTTVRSVKDWIQNHTPSTNP